MHTRLVALFLAFFFFTYSSYSYLAQQYGSGNVYSGSIDSFDHVANLVGVVGIGEPSQCGYDWALQGEVGGEVYLKWADNTDLNYFYEFKFQPLGIDDPVTSTESDFFTSNLTHSEFWFSGTGDHATQLSWEDSFYCSGGQRGFFFVTAKTGIAAICMFYNGSVTVDYEDSSETIYT